MQCSSSVVYQHWDHRPRLLGHHHVPVWGGGWLLQHPGMRPRCKPQPQSHRWLCRARWGHTCALSSCVPTSMAAPPAPQAHSRWGRLSLQSCSASPSAPSATCTEWVWVPGRDRGCRGHQSPVGRTEVHRALVPPAAQHRAVPTPIWLLGMCSITRPWVLGTVSAPACPQHVPIKGSLLLPRASTALRLWGTETRSAGAP